MTYPRRLLLLLLLYHLSKEHYITTAAQQEGEMLAGVVRRIENSSNDSGNHLEQSKDCFIHFQGLSFQVRYYQLSLFMLFASTFSIREIVISIKHNELRGALLCHCCLCVSLTCSGNECHLHMLVETAAISADSHVCAGLLSRVRKELGVNKKEESGYT